MDGSVGCDRVRCLIVSLAWGLLVMKRSKIRWALARLFPAKQHLLDALPIPAPLLDLVEVALVGIERIVRFFVGPVVGYPGLALLLRHPAQQ